jgi:hypothetical protein
LVWLGTTMNATHAAITGRGVDLSDRSPPRSRLCRV